MEDRNSVMGYRVSSSKEVISPFHSPIQQDAHKPRLDEPWQAMLANRTALRSAWNQRDHQAVRPFSPYHFLRRPE
jgi:hypothetical protein